MFGTRKQDEQLIENNEEMMELNENELEQVSGAHGRHHYHRDHDRQPSERKDDGG